MTWLEEQQATAEALLGHRVRAAWAVRSVVRRGPAPDHEAVFVPLIVEGIAERFVIKQKGGLDAEVFVEVTGYGEVPIEHCDDLGPFDYDA